MYVLYGMYIHYIHYAPVPLSLMEFKPMILLIAYEKGGTGKSTLAKNLAVYLQQQGRDLVTIDTDPQETLYRWCERRKDQADAKPITCVKLTGSKILPDLRSLSEKYADVIIDAGGADSPALRSAMAIATHLLVPMQPNAGDIEILGHMADLIEKAHVYNPNMKVRSVLTMCPTLPSRYSLILDAKDVCVDYGLKPLNAYTSRREIYDVISMSGLSVLESDNAKAKQEIIDIAQEILEA
jgi:chromosome partitioning protein